MLRLAIGIMVLGFSAHCAFALTSVAATEPLADDVSKDVRAESQAASAIWANPIAPAQVLVATAPVVPAPAAERALSANPLWAIPLSALSGTRDRPIFSASRRPIPAAVAPAAAIVSKPREPERPQLSLVGTIASDEEGFAIFLDQSTKAALHLKVGEDYQGWKLRSVQGRKATLEKDQQVLTLALPQSGDGQTKIPIEHRPSPVDAGKQLSVTLRPRPDDRSRR
ncbi:MAG: hypothetical protein K2W78_00525 [Xanthobacteraceae bacterium]|nr:hypothetical protein [Xanthobacteraceae bacterium]